MTPKIPALTVTQYVRLQAVALVVQLRSHRYDPSIGKIVQDAERLAKWIDQGLEQAP